MRSQLDPLDGDTAQPTATTVNPTSPENMEEIIRSLPAGARLYIIEVSPTHGGSPGATEQAKPPAAKPVRLERHGVWNVATLEDAMQMQAPIMQHAPPTPPRKPWLGTIGAGLAAGLVAVAIIALLKFAPKSDPTAYTRISQFSGADTFVNTEVPPEELSRRAEENFLAMLKAPTVEERKRFVLRPNEVEPQLQALAQLPAFQDLQATPPILRDANDILTPHDHRRGMVALSMQVPGMDCPAPIFFRAGLDGQPRLDFEFFAQQLTQKLRKFVASPAVGTSAIFRVGLLLDSPPPLASAVDGQRTGAYTVRLCALEAPELSMAFVADAATPLGEALAGRLEVARFSGNSATVELAWQESANGPQLVLSRLVSWDFLGLGTAERLDIAGTLPNATQLANRSTLGPNWLPAWIEE